MFLRNTSKSYKSDIEEAVNYSRTWVWLSQIRKVRWVGGRRGSNGSHCQESSASVKADPQDGMRRGQPHYFVAP